MPRIQHFYEQVILEMPALPDSPFKILSSTYYQLGLHIYEHLSQSTNFTIGYVPLLGGTTQSLKLLQAKHPKLRVVTVSRKELIGKIPP